MLTGSTRGPRVSSKKKKAPPTKDWKGPWDIAFYKSPKGEAPALSWLRSFPDVVEKRLVAIIIAVAQRPPPSFPSSSNEWRVMHTDMGGFFEARDQHDKTDYRVFCILDRNSHARPTVVLVSGGEKPDGTEMKTWVYREARGFREEYSKSRRIGGAPWPPTKRL